MARGKTRDEHTQHILKKLGKRIRGLRELRGEPNYERFAFKHDLNRSQLWRYENGEDLNFSSLIKIIKALDISVSDFFSDGFE